MPSLSLPLQFSGATTALSPHDLVLLEQKSWKRGRLSKSSLIRYLARILYAATRHGADDTTSDLVDCNLTPDNMILLGLYVYPLRAGVRYRLAATIGKLAGGEYEEIVEATSVQFTLKTTATMNHPATRLVGVKWLAGPWTADGKQLSNPELSLDSTDRRALIASVPIYGTAVVTAVIPRFVWMLELDWDTVARPALLQGWSEFAVAWPPPGRPIALALTAPPGAEEMAITGGTRCLYSLHIHSDDNWPPKAEGGKTKKIKCDYCELECEDEGTDE